MCCSPGRGRCPDRSRLDDPKADRSRLKDRPSPSPPEHEAGRSKLNDQALPLRPDRSCFKDRGPKHRPPACSTSNDGRALGPEHRPPACLTSNAKEHCTTGTTNHQPTMRSARQIRHAITVLVRLAFSARGRDYAQSGRSGPNSSENWSKSSNIGRQTW